MPARPDPYVPTMVRYVVAATLARGADAGAAVGLVLLAVASRPALPHAAAVGGALAAGLVVPHALGPLVARRLDLAADGRRVLAAAYVTYGAAVAGATALLGRVPVPLVLVVVVVGGACGPLLTGGLSSRLPGIAGTEGPRLRRAQGWDAVTYGLAGTVGPALVAALAAVAGPFLALLVLAVAAVLAGVVTLTLPRAGRPVTRAEVPRVRDVLGVLGRCGPLRRVNYATMLTAFGGGVVPVVAVLFARRLDVGPGAGAGLVAAYGLGNLAASLLVTLRPQRGEPDRLTTRRVALVGVALALCAVAPGYPVAVALFTLAGAAVAPFFTATLAARAAYAPVAARAQVFVTMAAVKIAAQGGGTALAGVLAGLGPRPVTALAGAVIVAGAAVTVLDRHLSAPRTVP